MCRSCHWYHYLTSWYNCPQPCDQATSNCLCSFHWHDPVWCIVFPGGRRVTLRVGHVQLDFNSYSGPKKEKKENLTKLTSPILKVSQLRWLFDQLTAKLHIWCGSCAGIKNKPGRLTNALKFICSQSVHVEGRITRPTNFRTRKSEQLLFLSWDAHCVTISVVSQVVLNTVCMCLFCFKCIWLWKVPHSLWTKKISFNIILSLAPAGDRVRWRLRLGAQNSAVAHAARRSHIRVRGLQQCWRDKRYHQTHCFTW